MIRSPEDDGILWINNLFPQQKKICSLDGVECAVLFKRMRKKIFIFIDERHKEGRMTQMNEKMDARRIQENMHIR